MRARTATLLAPAVLAGALLSVGGAQAAPATPATVARVLPAATLPYRLGFDRDSGPDVYHRTVLTSDASGQDQQAVTKPVDPAAVADDYDPAFTVDGTQVAYVEDPEPDNTDSHASYISVADADGGNPRRLDGTVFAGDHYGPTWSPDGSLIAYGANGDGSSVYVVRASDGVQLGALTYPNWYDFGYPAWSPSDPNTIVATAQSTIEPQLVRLTIAVSGDTVTVVALTVLDNPIDFDHGTGSSACQVLPGTPSQLPIFGGQLSSRIPELWDSAPAFTPDGGTIAFVAYQNRIVCEVNVDGSNGHYVAITGTVPPPATSPPTDYTPVLGTMAWSPDGKFLAVGVEVDAPVIGDVPAGMALARTASLATEIISLTVAADSLSAAAEVYVGNAESPAFDIQSGPVTLTVTADPSPGYVGGHTIDVTYTVSNQTARTITAPTLVAALPAQLPLAAVMVPPCTKESCLLGDVAPRSTVSVTFPLSPTQAVSALASGTVSFTDARGAPQLLTGQAPVVVKQPAVTLNPTLGPPGIVTVITGTSFPPGAKVRFTWNPGITAPTTVTVRPDGTFVKQMLVLPHDTLGPRTLTVHGFTGPLFGDLKPVPPFLVVPGDPEPPRFFGRG